MIERSHRKATSADDALRELRVAIEHHRREETDFDDLRATLRDFCAEARREQMPPERVIVAVKTALDALPAERADSPALRESTRADVVSLAIRTFYTDDGAMGGEHAE
jgi:hypothetical protein